MIPIQNFRACITTHEEGQPPHFQACRVIGVNEACQFIVIVEDEKRVIEVIAVDRLDFFDNDSPVHGPI